MSAFNRSIAAGSRSHDIVFLPHLWEWLPATIKNFQNQIFTPEHAPDQHSATLRRVYHRANSKLSVPRGGF